MLTQRPGTTSSRDRMRWAWVPLLSLVTFAVSSAFFATVPRFEAPYPSAAHRLLHDVSFVLWWEGFALAVVVAVAVAVVRARGVVWTLAVVAAGAAGVGVNLGGIGLTGEPTLGLRLGWMVVVAFAVTLVLGGAGYLLGVGLSAVAGSRGS